MQSKSRKFLSVLLALLMMAGVIAVAPVTASAATGMATIDISTLGGANANNSAASATEAQWAYNGSTKALTLSTASGNYTLSGTNTNLTVRINAADINATLNSVSIEATSVNAALQVNGDRFTVTLVGSNTFTTDVGIGLHIATDGISGTITSNSGGILTTTSGENTYEGLRLTTNTTLSITGTAAVITASGPGRGGMVVPATSGVLMGDNAKLTITNSRSSADTHTFGKANAANNYKWKLTSATLASGALTDASISVSIAAGATGTIEREALPIVCEIGATEYAYLADALAAAVDGDTIKLLADINYSIGLSVSGKSIILDLNGYTLNTRGLLATTGGELRLADPNDGEFNVTYASAGSTAISINSGCYAEVTNVSYLAPGYGTAIAVGGELVVYGNVLHTGAPGTNYAASAYSGGKITIEGAITVDPGVVYVRLQTTDKTQAQFTTPTTKAGYLTYTDGTSTVWVKCQAHEWGAGWENDATTHRRGDCTLCGAQDTAAAHTPGSWIEDTAATYTAPGSQHKECTACGYVTETGTIPATGVAPGISGPTALMLLAGYGATSTGAYTVTGTPAPTVTATGNAKITWNATTKKLDIAPGLTAGEYTVVLTASNGVGTAKTATFKLTVAKTIFSTKHESNFWNWLLFFLGFGFIWMWFI